jgi:peptidyl-prolyl cis-trans isomerase SurA
VWEALACLVLILVIPLRAEIVDRIAMSAGNRVITRSEIDREIRVTAFQDGVTPDFSPANRRAIAEKMVDQKLIQRELETSRYPLPTAAELTPAIEEFKRTHFPDDAAYRKALADAGITEKDLLDVLLWERTLLRFIELRFESGVLLSDQEVGEYAKEKNLSSADAEKQLISARADQQMEQWLRDARKRTPVIVHEEAFH